jgi:hydrogenase maturation protease HycI
VGIGHELRGDDAVGVTIVRRLQETCSGRDSLLLLDAGSAPENCTGTLRRFMPDTVLFIDAVDIKQPSDNIQMIDLENIYAVAASTHTLSLNLIADFLKQEIGCDVLLLGIQTLQNELDTPLSADVQTSVDAIVKSFVKFVTI